MGKLPVLEDSAVFGQGPGSALPESGAILRYLVRRFCPTRSSFYHLYPHADAAASALVDAAVDWHFSALRPGCSGVVWALVLAKTVPRGGTPRRPEAETAGAAAAALASLELALDALEGTSSSSSGGGGGNSASSSSSSSSCCWLLLDGGGFLAGRGKPSVADLLVATELDQLRLLDALGAAGESGSSESSGSSPPPPPCSTSSSRPAPSMASLLAKRPRVRAYLSRVRDAVGAETYDGVSSVLDRVVANLKEQRRRKEAEAERPRL